MADFKLGDVVRLKSGGPWMTITYISQRDRTATCTWFIKDEEVKWHEFPFEALEYVDQGSQEIDNPSYSI